MSSKKQKAVAGKLSVIDKSVSHSEKPRFIPKPNIPAGLAVPGFTITATSLSIDDSVTLEQAKQYLVSACRIGTSAQWWVGDILNIMEKRWQVNPEEVMRELGLLDRWSKGYCKNLKYVSGKVDGSHRCDLEWSLHQVVAPLPPAQQKKFLEEARVAHLTRKKLADKVAGRVTPPGKPRRTGKPEEVNQVTDTPSAIQAMESVGRWLEGDGDRMTSEQRESFLKCFESLKYRVGRVKRQVYGDKRAFENAPPPKPVLAKKEKKERRGRDWESQAGFAPAPSGDEDSHGKTDWENRKKAVKAAAARKLREARSKKPAAGEDAHQVSVRAMHAYNREVAAARRNGMVVAR